MVCETPCKNCTRKGLPILFTRYAAAYSVQDKGMTALRAATPSGQFEASPNGIDVTAAAYNVRMLRPGYLYLYIERETEKTWEAYAVHPHGYLNPFLVEAPDTAKAKVACARDTRQANNSLVWVDDAEHVVKLWYMFCPDPLDYQHLKSEIEPNRTAYMQSMDVASWLKGNHVQQHTCDSADLDMQVVEFAALKNDALRDAIEPQLYGLMGANPEERGWSDYEVTLEALPESAMHDGGWALAHPTTYTKRQPSYSKAHGWRLMVMRTFLMAHKGAVAACEDPIGIAQELGHLQSEAQNFYAHWQISQAAGFGKGVTNEWVLQTTVNAQSLAELVKKNAVARTNKRIEQWNEMLARYDAADFNPGRTPEERARYEQEKAANRAKAKANQQAEMEAAKTKGEAEFAKYYDKTQADKFVEQVHKPAIDAVQALRQKLGEDQGKWLKSEALQTAMKRYSDKEDRINRCGGGANLSLQLGQCLAGTESNRWGTAWLAGLDPWGDNVLSRLLCFNHPPYLTTLKQAVDAQTAQMLPPPRADAPETETDVWRLSMVSLVLRAVSNHAALGDKALGFMEAFPAIGASGALRKLAWPAHVMSLMSVKLMQAIQAAPVTGREMQLVRYAALAGVGTLGRTVETEVRRLRLQAEDIQRWRVRSRKFDGLIRPQGGDSGAAAQGRINRAVPGTRAAMLGGLFDFGAALLKVGQMGANPRSANARGVTELAGNVFQAIGSIADFRAKAYEEVVFKGIRGVDVYSNTKAALQRGLDDVNAAGLRALQKTAFRWLLPAAMISVWFDCVDARLSRARGQKALAYAQTVSAIGTALGIGSVASLAFGWTAFGLTPAALGALLGMIGIVIAVGAMIVIAWLKEEDWINWLIDCPLNKSKKPNHDDLQETMQKYANAIADLGGAG